MMLLRNIIRQNLQIASSGKARPKICCLAQQLLPFCVPDLLPSAYILLLVERSSTRIIFLLTRDCFLVFVVQRAIPVLVLNAATISQAAINAVMGHRDLHH